MHLVSEQVRRSDDFLIGEMATTPSHHLPDTGISRSTPNSYNGSWYDALFSASFALFMVVAIRGRELPQRQETTEDHAFASWTSRLAVLAVLSLPVIIVFALLDRSVPSVIGRFREQCRLYDELGRANKTLESGPHRSTYRNPKSTFLFYDGGNRCRSKDASLLRVRSVFARPGLLSSQTSTISRKSTIVMDTMLEIGW